MLFESTALVTLLASFVSANSSSIWSTTDRVIPTSRWSTTDRVITTSQWSTTDRVITTSKTISRVSVPTENVSTVCITTPGAISTTTGGKVTMYTTHLSNATKTENYTSKPTLPTEGDTTDAVFTTSNAITKNGTAIGANLPSSSTSNAPSSSSSSAARSKKLKTQGFPLVPL